MMKLHSSYKIYRYLLVFMSLSSILSLSPTEMPSTSPLLSEMPSTSSPSSGMPVTYQPSMPSKKQISTPPPSSGILSTFKPSSGMPSTNPILPTPSPSSEMPSTSSPSSGMPVTCQPSSILPSKNQISTPSPSSGMPTVLSTDISNDSPASSLTPSTSPTSSSNLLTNLPTPSPSATIPPPSDSPTYASASSLSPSAAPSRNPSMIQPYICLYGNCQGASAKCIPGAICQYSNPNYSQCVEDPAYATQSNCRKTNEYGCGPASSCCNPSAVCSADGVCVLPQPGCVNDAAAASSAPTQALSLQPVRPTPAPTSRSPVATPLAPPTNVVCLWGNCNAPSSTCAVGLTCKYQSPYYSQCVEDTSYSAGRTDCRATNAWGCGGASGGPSGCCNPGAGCNSQSVCEIPTTDCKQFTASPSLSGTSRPTAAVSNLPPSAPFPVSRTICLYGDCTDPSTRCIAGAVCQKQNPFYSQCLEDDQYSAAAAAPPSSSCHSKYDWGCGGGQGATGCCNPAAACDSNHMCQLSSACVYYYAASATAAAPPPPPAPQISFVSTIGIAMPAGTTSLSDGEQLAVCLSSELAVSAPPGSCSVVTVSPAEKAAGSPLLLLATTTTIYATTKITASANSFQSFPATQNVTLLFQQLSQSLSAAVQQGSFVKALQSNSRSLNCSRTASASLVGQVVVDPLTVVPAAGPSAAPSSAKLLSGQPTGAASSSSTPRGSGSDSSQVAVIIGSVVGGCAIAALAAFFFVLLHKRDQLSRRGKGKEGGGCDGDHLAPPSGTSTSSDEVLVERTPVTRMLPNQ